MWLYQGDNKAGIISCGGGLSWKLYWILHESKAVSKRKRKEKRAQSQPKPCPTQPQAELGPSKWWDFHHPHYFLLTQTCPERTGIQVQGNSAVLGHIYIYIYILQIWLLAEIHPENKNTRKWCSRGIWVTLSDSEWLWVTLLWAEVHFKSSGPFCVWTLI